MSRDIILLHGWGGNKKSLENLANELKEFNVHILEMPGHGNTKLMSLPWNMKHFALWIIEYIKSQEIHNPILIGHSFGGRIILEILINHKLNISKAVLIDSSGVKPKNNLKRKFWKVLAQTYNIFAKLPLFKLLLNSLRFIVYKYIIREKDYYNTHGTLKETFKIINDRYYTSYELAKIDKEVLVIWGGNDTITPLWMGQQLAKYIPKAKLKVLKGAHNLPIKNYNEVAKIILEFLK